MTEYKIGDKVRYKGNLEGPFIKGKDYTILSVNKFDTDVIDDYGRFDALSYVYLRNYFELVSEPNDALQTTCGEQSPTEYVVADEETPVEASPTVIELLANISRRLYEAEQTIKSQAYEINELYKAVSQ